MKYILEKKTYKLQIVIKGLFRKFIPALNKEDNSVLRYSIIRATFKINELRAINCVGVLNSYFRTVPAFFLDF
jgi:hypothetical protein